MESGAPGGGKVEKSMRGDGSAITVKGLKAGDQVIFSGIQSQGEGAPVTLGEDSPYYVRGLRKSGYDNDTVAAPSFMVEQDQDWPQAVFFTEMRGIGLWWRFCILRAMSPRLTI